jgi:hypothetical protein
MAKQQMTLEELENRFEKAVRPMGDAIEMLDEPETPHEFVKSIKNVRDIFRQVADEIDQQLNELNLQ